MKIENGVGDYRTQVSASLELFIVIAAPSNRLQCGIVLLEILTIKKAPHCTYTAEVPQQDGAPQSPKHRHQLVHATQVAHP